MTIGDWRWTISIETVPQNPFISIGFISELVNHPFCQVSDIILKIDVWAILGHKTADSHMTISWNLVDSNIITFKHSSLP